MPPATVEAFLARLLPSEATRLFEAGDEASLRRAIELEPGRADARVALATILLERGESEAAFELLRPGRARRRRRRSARARRARRRSRWPRRAWRLRSRRSAAASRSRRSRDCSPRVGESQGDTRDRVRRVMVGIFVQLGNDHPLSVSFRRQLARALY